MVSRVVVYTLCRVAIFAVLLAVVWAVGVRSYGGILLALLLSLPASYFLLGPQRAALAEAIAERRTEKAELRARMRGDSDRQTDGEQDTEK